MKVELVGLARVERMESQSLPPSASAGVQRRDDHGLAGGFLVQLDGGGEHMRRECGPDPEVPVAPADCEATSGSIAIRCWAIARHPTPVKSSRSPRSSPPHSPYSRSGRTTAAPESASDSGVLLAPVNLPTRGCCRDGRISIAPVGQSARPLCLGMALVRGRHRTPRQARHRSTRLLLQHSSGDANGRRDMAARGVDQSRPRGRRGRRDARWARRRDHRDAAFHRRARTGAPA